MINVKSCGHYIEVQFSEENVWFSVETCGDPEFITVVGDGGFRETVEIPSRNKWSFPKKFPKGKYRVYRGICDYRTILMEFEIS